MPPQEPKPFNEIAKSFDPMMDQQTYDQLRHKYFDDYVAPHVKQTFSLGATRQAFFEQTERPKLVQNPRLAQGQLAAQRAINEIMKPVATMNANAKQELQKGVAQTDQLAKNLQRDGISTTIPEVAGELTGVATGFGLAEAATGGIGEVAELPQLLEQTSLTASHIALANRITKGALAFGTYEALVATNNHRGFAFAKGAAEGGAAEAGLSLVGKLISRGKVKPEDIEKEIAKTLSANPNPNSINPEVDKILASHIEREQVQAKKLGMPMSTIPDYSVDKLKIETLSKEGRIQTFNFTAGTETSNLVQIKQITDNGGQVVTTSYNPDHMGYLGRVNKMMERLNKPSSTRVVTVPIGQEKKVATSMSQEGLTVEPAGKGRVQVETNRVTKPSIGDITSALQAHELPDGTKLSPGEIWDTAKRIQLLQDPQAKTAVKEITARQLAGKGLEDKFIPLRWHRSPEQAVDNVISRDVADIPKSEAQQNMEQEIADKSKSIPPIAQMEGVLKNGQLASGYHVESPQTLGDKLLDRARPLFDKEASPEDVAKELGISQAKARSLENKYFKEMRESRNAVNLRIPPSEAFTIEHTSSGPRVVNNEDVRVKKGNQRTRMLVSPGQLSGFDDQASAITLLHSRYTDVLDEMGVTHPGFEEGVQGHKNGKWDPLIVLPHPEQGSSLSKLRQDYSETLYHETLHAHIENGGGFEIPVGDRTSTDIASALERNHGYEGSIESLHEEAFVHAATAVKMNDEQTLYRLAHYDTSVEKVLDMVDSTSEKWLTKLETQLDNNSTRDFKSKLEDLRRRVGRDSLTRLTDGARRNGLDVHYDPVSNTYVMHDVEGLIHMDQVNEVASYINDHDGSQYVPSESLGFEWRGLRHPIAFGGGPNGHLPMPEVSPGERGRFQGVMAASSFIRPTLDWAASVDKKFEVVYKDKGFSIPFYNRFKDVDDAVRLGADWMENKHRTAAEFIKGPPERAKMLMQFMSADKRFWPVMIEKFKMDDNFLSEAKQASQWLTDFESETGIKVHNYLLRDLPRLRDFNYESGPVYGSKSKNPEDMVFFHKAIVEGSLKPSDEHLGRFISWLMREGYEKKFTGPALKNLKALVDLKGKDGTSILGTLRFPVDNYINYVKGIPDATQLIMNKTVSDFQKSLGVTFARINKILPKKYQLPEEFNYPSSVVNKLLSLSYVAGIGLRPIIPVRDAIQVLTNTLPILGPQKFLAGAAKALTSEGFKEARMAGALLGRHNLGDLYGDINQEIGPHSGSTLDKAMDIANKLMSPSRWGHNVGRAITYHGEYGSAVKAINQYRKGSIPVNQLFEDTSMWFFSKPLQTRFMKTIMEGATSEDIAHKMALETVDATLWPYRRGTQPLALRLGVGRIFGQYALWSFNYMEFIKKITLKYAEHPSKAMQATGLWLSTNYAASQALGAMGGDVSKWFFLSPSGYSGSPHLELALNLMKAPEESQDGRDARKRILEYPLNFVPASLEVEAILKSIESGESPFENGKPTPSLIRVLGMRPKHEHLQDLTPEEWMQYETGFKERR